MKPKKGWRFLGFCFLTSGCVIFLTTCHRSDISKENRKPRIGLALDSLVVERWRRDMDSFVRAARDLNADVILRVANQDASTQIQQVKELVQSGIDVLVLIPNDAEKLSEVVKQVKRKRIPVISYDRLVHNANVDLYISFDNERVGSLMAESAVEIVPKGNYVIINGAITDNNSYMINRGFHTVLDPRIAKGEIHLVAEIWPNDWISDEVKPRFEQLLVELKDTPLDVVLCGNDMLAETVISLLSENRRIAHTKVFGQDAELSACQRIAEGSQYGTIYKPIELLALRAAAFAVMLARKEPITTDLKISDGTYQVPYFRLEPIMVTRERLKETVIKDGFHRYEEVFRNVLRGK
ncbi:MAG: substrate-binding domain-containing protein [Treponemataceae bacterium]|nr:substrate-binding domain-containing protein [Treponemataceae bacterium]